MDKDNEKDLALKVATNTIGVFLLPGAVVFNGYVLQTFWTWFVTAAFSIPAPSLPLCIGLALLVRVVTFAPTGKNKGKNMLEAVLESVMLSAAVLGIGWIVHQFA